MTEQAQRVVARYLVARGIGLGKTWENGRVRIHRYANFYKVWDLANAGKRGKKVRVMRISPNVRYEREWLETQGKFITHHGTYDAIKRFYQDLLHDFPGEISVEEHQERGIDVLPGGTRTIKLKWSMGTTNLSLEATPLDFGVTSSVLMGANEKGQGGFRQDTLYWPRKKADAKRFYGWLAGEGEGKVKRMDIMALRKLWSSIDVQYDFH